MPAFHRAEPEAGKPPSLECATGEGLLVVKGV
jgi:hypothetical protein